MAPPDRTVLMFLYSELVVELALGDGTRGECAFRSAGGTVRGSTDILPELALLKLRWGGDTVGRIICSKHSNADQYCSELLDRWTDGRTDRQ